MCLKPAFVDLDRQSSNEPETTLRVREDAHHMGTALELLIESLQNVGAFKVLAMPSWAGGNTKLNASGPSWPERVECTPRFSPDNTTKVFGDFTPFIKE